MPPNSETTTVTETVRNDRHHQKPAKQLDIVWRNVAIFTVLHLLALYGIYLFIFEASWPTIAFFFLYGNLSGLGVTAGAHRLWSHKSYKARLPLRIVLMIMNCIACQNSLYEWTRDHRVHHKFSETDADPHNVKRGFFFAHMGWLLCKKHPDVLNKGKSVDVSDLLQDPVVRFQKKYYIPLTLFFAFILSTILPNWLWGETYKNSFFVTTVFRYVLSLHFTWLVNSAAHLYGNRPYDNTINPRENKFVAFAAVGEGYHNYHHTFPWDYSTSEHGWKINFTTMFLDFMAMIGQVYDRRTVSKETLNHRIRRTGDGTHVD